MEYINREKLSDEAKAFLENLQNIQDEFAQFIGGYVMFINKEGKLATKPSNAQRVCQEYIQKTNLGKKGCDHLIGGATIKLLSFREKVLRMKCVAGYQAFWIPIKLKGKVVGAVAACGGLMDEGKTEEDYKKDFTRLAELFDISDSEDFYEAAIKEPEKITKENLDNRTNKISKLLKTLSKERSFEEVFKPNE